MNDLRLFFKSEEQGRLNVFGSGGAEKEIPKTFPHAIGV